MVKGRCTIHGDWNNWKSIGDKNVFDCPKCLTDKRNRRLMNYKIKKQPKQNSKKSIDAIIEIGEICDSIGIEVINE